MRFKVPVPEDPTAPTPEEATAEKEWHRDVSRLEREIELWSSLNLKKFLTGK